MVGGGGSRRLVAHLAVGLVLGLVHQKLPAQASAPLRPLCAAAGVPAADRLRRRPSRAAGPAKRGLGDSDGITGRRKGRARRRFPGIWFVRLAWARSPRPSHWPAARAWPALTLRRVRLGRHASDDLHRPRSHATRRGAPPPRRRAGGRASRRCRSPGWPCRP